MPPPENPPSPPESPSSWEVARTAISANPQALGPRLLVLAQPPPPPRGASGSLLGLDSEGDLVLVAGFGTLPAGISQELSDELDRLAHLSEAELSGAAGSLQEGATLTEAHSLFFERDRPVGRLNRRQRLLLVAEPADTGTWKDLRADLGPALEAVFSVHEGELVAQQPPSGGPRGTLRTRALQGAALLLAGWAGFALGSAGGDPEPEPGTLAGGSAVAGQVPPDATHTRWVGQRRLARTSDGHLLAVYPSEEGLRISFDRRNRGRSWQSPQLVESVRSNSIATAIDPADRLHVAFQDAHGVGYLYLDLDPDGTAGGEVIRVDPAATSPVVDIAFDPASSTAHIVWVAGEEDAQKPRWAAFSSAPGQEPDLLAEQDLAGPGTELSALVGVASDPAGGVIAAYRRPDSTEGWFSRYLPPPDGGRFEWDAEQRLPTPDAQYGAASLAPDPLSGIHLVLRDNTTYGLTYLRWTDEVWQEPELAVDARSTEEIDFPTLSVEPSGDVYLVYQDTSDSLRAHIRLAVRDPVSGWGQPMALSGAGGMLYPTTISAAQGAAIVLLTAQDPPAVRAFRAAD